MENTPSKPTPDPTVLTTEALQREVGQLKELSNTAIAALDERMELQFSLVERQRVEQKSDTALAVNAALSAAKEAVKEQTLASGLAINKSEVATAEQLKQLNVTINTAISGVSSALADVKTRVERIENVKQGAKENMTSLYVALGASVTVISLVSVVGNLLTK